MTKQGIVAALAALGVAVAVFSAAANAAEIKVISTGSFKAAFAELAPAFERSSGHKATAIWAGTDEIISRLGAGETLDIVIAPAPWIDDMIKRGLLVAGSRVDVAKSGIGAAVHAGAPRIDIGSADALKSALLGAKSIVLSTGVSGIYLAKLFAKWGVSERLEPKIKRLPGSGPVADAMARGEAEIGFLQVSEWLGVAGVEPLGPLPADIQEITAISAGLNKAAGAPDAASALVKFLASPEAAPAKRKTGLEPG
jgi:molybdate transport system substrate-binding protein